MGPTNKVPFHWVGKLRADVTPAVLPCGHVQLIRGNDDTVVEFETAWHYAETLREQLVAAREKARGN